MIAAKENNVQVAIVFIRFGANVLQTNIKEESPLSLQPKWLIEIVRPNKRNEILDIIKTHVKL